MPWNSLTRSSASTQDLGDDPEADFSSSSCSNFSKFCCQKSNISPPPPITSILKGRKEERKEPDKRLNCGDKRERGRFFFWLDFHRSLAI